MAWTAPMTAASNGTLTAAQWNTHIRDNLLETEAAKATKRPEFVTDPDSANEIVPGAFFVATGLNAIAERRITEGNQSRGETETTTSTTYTDLDQYGPSITVATGTRAIVMVASEMTNALATEQAFADFTVAGATTRAATDTTALIAEGYSTSGSQMCRRASYARVTLTAGANVFTMKYRTSNASNSASFRKRQIVVWPV